MIHEGIQVPRGIVGNEVKDQDMADAIFHDLGNSPATFEASRWADWLDL